MKIWRIIAFILLAYSLCVALGIESINSQEEGGILQNWHREQQMAFPDRCCGSGQGKMRTHGEFQSLLFVFGTLAYPACAFSALLFVREARSTKDKAKKSIAIFCCVICVAILLRFFSLGVFSAGAHIG